MFPQTANNYISLQNFFLRTNFSTWFFPAKWYKCWKCFHKPQTTILFKTFFFCANTFQQEFFSQIKKTVESVSANPKQLFSSKTFFFAQTFQHEFFRQINTTVENVYTNRKQLFSSKPFFLRKNFSTRIFFANKYHCRKCFRKPQTTILF